MLWSQIVGVTSDGRWHIESSRPAARRSRCTRTVLSVQNTPSRAASGAERRAGRCRITGCPAIFVRCMIAVDEIRDCVVRRAPLGWRHVGAGPGFLGC